MPLYPIDTNVPALKTGYTQVSDASCVQFAVFTAEQAQKLAENHAEIAEGLTGWYRYYRGPGRAFAHEPVARVFGKKVLVTQVVGNDI